MNLSYNNYHLFFPKRGKECTFFYIPSLSKGLKSKKMELTTETLQRFVGGQAEIQNQHEGYLYRGEIKEAIIEGSDLTLRFNWQAQGVGYPPMPEKWVKADHEDYKASLEIYSAKQDDEGRIILDSPIVGELTVLFPKGGSRLDPSKVEGLENL